VCQFGYPAGRRTTKLGAGIRHQLVDIVAASRGELGLDFLGMRQAVGSSIEPVDHERFVLLSRRIVGALRRRDQNGQAQEGSADEPRAVRFHEVSPCRFAIVSRFYSHRRVKH